MSPQCRRGAGDGPRSGGSTFVLGSEGTAGVQRRLLGAPEPHPRAPRLGKVRQRGGGGLRQRPRPGEGPQKAEGTCPVTPWRVPTLGWGDTLPSPFSSLREGKGRMGTERGPATPGVPATPEPPMALCDPLSMAGNPHTGAKREGQPLGWHRVTLGDTQGLTLGAAAAPGPAPVPAHPAGGPGSPGPPGSAGSEGPGGERGAVPAVPAVSPRCPRGVTPAVPAAGPWCCGRPAAAARRAAPTG